ncbi:hypothetical protein [Halomonas sp. CKK8]|uniref:hypothetical protein n=1 Tax=Halomonas sp. CKK8 TaxID=3036127 RepID=UPI002414D5B0|nr:hypothetical protein [Halomonas sp. CKK8]WFM69802.1 hypothetical protein P8934_10220 [Halomonas sp. CKK8]
MFNNVLTILRWFYSIGKKFVRVVPTDTLIVVLATLVSQFSILLAFLLPLKIIMLLGSDGIPRYFPSFFADYDRDILVVVLGLAAFGFYLVYFVAEKVIYYGSRHGANMLLLKSHKMPLFENQEDVAGRGYQRYARSLASIVFLLLVSTVLFLIYPDLLMVLLGYIVLSSSVLVLLYQRGGEVKASLEKSPGSVVSTTTSIGFLFSFAFMLGQFLLATPPGLLVAIISLILMRQGFSRLNGLVNDLNALYSQRLKLNALFFHGHVLVSETKRHETNFWALHQSPQRSQWICEIVKSITNHPIKDVSVHWYQLGIPDVSALRVEVFDDQKNTHDEFLVKVFNSNRSSLAKHEATLLAEVSQLPTFELLSVEEVQGLHCLVMQWCSARKVPPKQIIDARFHVMSCLLAMEPAENLVSRFKRSRPPLWQRIDRNLLERLETVAEMLTDEDLYQVKSFSQHSNEVIQRLQQLPLTIVNPDLVPGTTLQRADGEFISIHWGRWSLEPAGAGWPVHKRELQMLGVALTEAQEKRRELKGVIEEDVHLAALVFTLEKLCVRQQFASALKLVPRILECLREGAIKTSSATML